MKVLSIDWSEFVVFTLVSFAGLALSAGAFYVLCYTDIPIFLSSILSDLLAILFVFAMSKSAVFKERTRQPQLGLYIILRFLSLVLFAQILVVVSDIFVSSVSTDMKVLLITSVKIVLSAGSLILNFFITRFCIKERKPNVR